MNIPPKESPFWGLLIQAWLFTSLLLFAAFAFKNGMSPMDIISTITAMGGVFGIQFTRRTIAPSDASPAPPPDAPIKPRLSGDQ